MYRNNHSDHDVVAGVQFLAADVDVQPVGACNLFVVAVAVVAAAAAAVVVRIPVDSPAVAAVAYLPMLMRVHAMSARRY